MTEMTSVADDFDRSIRLKLAIEKSFKDNEDLLNKLGSDYDENEVAYWTKYEERLKYMEENGI
jgi:hypothetical protein